jgi:hypothetical protein
MAVDRTLCLVWQAAVWCFVRVYIFFIDTMGERRGKLDKVDVPHDLCR